MRRSLDIVAAVAMTTASIVMVWAVLRQPRSGNDVTRPPIDTPPVAPVPLDGAALRGVDTATVAIVEFLDFQCPFCSRFATESLPQLLKKYVNDGRVVYGVRHLPLDTINPLASTAARMAECGTVHGNFWAIHDAFLEVPVLRTDAELRARAQRAGLTNAQWADCEKDSRIEAKLRADIEMAQGLGLKSTPVFLIGNIVAGQVKVTRVLRGARPLKDFEASVEEALASGDLRSRTR